MDIKGKTIERYTNHDMGYMCLFFTDGTHQIFSGGSRYEDCPYIEMIPDANVDAYDLHELDVLSDSELHEREEADARRAQYIQEQIDRKQYELLKAKYEGKP